MFIYNVSLNKTKLVKLLFAIAVIILICLFFYAIFRIINDVDSSTCQPEINVIELSGNNYTNVLKEVHDNLDKYIGKKIKFTGYVYRVPDFDDTQFVLARDMIISSDLKTLVVGFLCVSKDAKKIKENTWVEITGTITKGSYHEDVPVIEVKDINTISKPADIYVYPPDNSFVPTANIFKK